MIEIEFRAWNGREMCQNFTIDADDGMPRLVGYSIHGEPTDAVPHWKIMQFTGLRDKNGVKIFCGDIVYFNGGDICEVIFENGCFWAANEQLSKHPIGQWLHYSESAVVIGNVHQHQHLLEQKK